MSMTCDSCGKGRMKGNKVSHAKNRTIRFFKPNLHKWQGGRLCSGCLKKAKSVKFVKV